jgi:transcriptional regulator with XRE-family HTH domain
MGRMTALHDEENFARRMAELRTDLGMSQSELARRMVENGFDSYSQMTVSRTEKGDRPIRLGEARVLARILNSSVEEMTRGTALEESISLAELLARGLGAEMLATFRALGNYFEALEHAIDVKSRLSAYDTFAAREALENLTMYMYPPSVVAAWAAEAVTDPMRDASDALVWTDFSRMDELRDGASPRTNGGITFGVTDGEHPEAP